MASLNYKTVVGIVVDGDDILLLKKQGKWIGWGFPQGAKEKGETREEAILREIKEETDIDGKIIMELPIKLSYDYEGKFGDEKGKDIHKDETFFIIKADKSQPIKLSIEHSDFKWCKIEEAKKLLMHQNNKKALKVAAEELKKIKGQTQLK